MATNPITGISSTTTQSSNSVPLNMQINQAQFLQLITAQLQDQNPLSPTDPTQFVSQLEGMSQVSSMMSMQSSLQASQLLSGTNFLGHSVLAPGTTATLASGGVIGGAVQAPAGTSKLTVSITDSSGNPMTTFNVTPQDSGLTSFTWNGKTGTGATAPAGQYTIAVNATVNGATQAVNPNVVTKVESVLIDPTTQAVDLDTDSGVVPLSSVISVF
ncbi:MAG TPA: FlgD immunoglobulin-like domain containing protein [Steroidobacteraceae bacterium]|nr:FlgD immunoglobulin-like domain containing protein [Steroidobacteraceae bacterium]